MISFRQSDLIDRILIKRAIYFFNDNRDQIKYYNKSTDTFYDPKKNVSVNYTEMFSPDFRMVERRGIVVIIDCGSSTGDLLGKPVFEDEKHIGNFYSLTQDGMLVVEMNDNEIYFDPTAYVITKSSSEITIRMDRA